MEEHYLSIAELDDQDGECYHFKYNGKLTLQFILDKVNSCCKSKYIIDDYILKSLIDDGYYIYFNDKYYHFVMAIDFKCFELESKGVSGGVFKWKNIPKDQKLNSSVYNISHTGEHMWMDEYSIRCYSHDCDYCNE